MSEIIVVASPLIISIFNYNLKQKMVTPPQAKTFKNYLKDKK